MCIYNSKYGETLENKYKRKEEELGTPHWMCGDEDETGKERIMKKVEAFFLVLAEFAAGRAFLCSDRSSGKLRESGSVELRRAHRGIDDFGFRSYG